MSVSKAPLGSSESRDCASGMVVEPKSQPAHLPVRISSAARCGPTTDGSQCVLPIPGGNPSPTKVIPIFASLHIVSREGWSQQTATLWAWGSVLRRGDSQVTSTSDGQTSTNRWTIDCGDHRHLKFADRQEARVEIAHYPRVVGRSVIVSVQKKL